MKHNDRVIKAYLGEGA
ncbi:hypothetical protein [Bavariicoccus seileri]